MDKVNRDVYEAEALIHNPDSLKTTEEWTSLKSYLARHCKDFNDRVFRPSNRNTQLINFSLERMHTKAGFDFVCQHVNSEKLAEIIKHDGLPLPFIIESEMTGLLEKASFNSMYLKVILKDQYKYSDWVNRLLTKIEPSFIPTQQILLPKKNYYSVNKLIKSICLTPQECDAYEMLCLIRGDEVERSDSLSVLNDPAITNVINLYKYLNDTSHKILLSEVVQSNLDYHTFEPSELFNIADRVERKANGLSVSEEVPEELNYVVDLCRFYTKGVTIEGLTTFMTVMIDTPSNLDTNRLKLLNQYIKMNMNRFDTHTKNTGRPLVLVNSLVSPIINANSTLISNAVEIEHLHINKGTHIKLIQFSEIGVHNVK